MPPEYERTTITVRSDLMNLAKRRAAELGFENSFSAYISYLAKKDLADHPETARHFSASPSPKTTVEMLKEIPLTPAEKRRRLKKREQN